VTLLWDVQIVGTENRSEISAARWEKRLSCHVREQFSSDGSSCLPWQGAAKQVLLRWAEARAEDSSVGHVLTGRGQEASHCDLATHEEGLRVGDGRWQMGVPARLDQHRKDAKRTGRLS
jgi:hypothetical protein